MRMAKLSENNELAFERMDDEIDRSIEFMDRLLEMADKRRGTPGSNQALKEFLPAPYLLHHICPAILKRADLRATEATILSRVPGVLREIEMRTFVKHPRLSRLPLAAEYLTATLYGLEMEHFYMLCLDQNGRLKENVLLNKGVYDASVYSLRYLLEQLRRVKPDCVILCHNHPGGSSKPSKDDLDCTAETLYGLTAEGVPMLDHIIVCTEGAVSIRANGFIPERYWLNQKRGHRLLENFLSEDNMPDRSVNRVRESYLFGDSGDNHEN